MISIYRKHGVVTWIADPDLRSVAVHRAGHPYRTFHEGEELDGGPTSPASACRWPGSSPESGFE